MRLTLRYTPKKPGPPGFVTRPAYFVVDETAKGNEDPDNFIGAYKRRTDLRANSPIPVVCADETLSLAEEAGTRHTLPKTMRRGTPLTITLTNIRPVDTTGWLRVEFTNSSSACVSRAVGRSAHSSYLLTDFAERALRRKTGHGEHPVYIRITGTKFKG